MLSLVRFVYYTICSLYPSPQLPQPLLPVPAFVTIMATWGSSPFPPSFHLFPSASILPQLARRLHSTPRYFAELVLGLFTPPPKLMMFFTTRSRSAKPRHLRALLTPADRRIEPLLKSGPLSSLPHGQRHGHRAVPRPKAR